MPPSSAIAAAAREAPESSQAASPSVLVLQVGARLHYGVPAVYARAGALKRLYTDACASVGALDLARRLIPAERRPAALRRLLGRTLPPDLPPERVHVETFWTLAERLHVFGALRHDALVTTHERLRRRALARRFEGANCLYCVDNGDLALMRAARDAGLALVYEQLICPSVGRILREERRRFPGLEPETPDEVIERGIARDTQVFELVHHVICASDFVQSDVASFTPKARTAVVPYGVHQEWLDLPSAPIPGRILFVGTVGLRKGNHYLAEAARILKARRVPCEVRVVGPCDPEVIARPEFQGPVYVGQVPREQVRREFAQADVFTIPTLADGFAIVHLEAFACGVPVVTTPNCGSQVRNDHDGFIVPIRDATALADRLEQLVTDRELRARMSRAARARAVELNWTRFGELLLDATNDAVRDARSERHTVRDA